MGAGKFSDILGVFNPFRFRSYTNSGLPTLAAGDTVYVTDANGPTRTGCLAVSDGSSAKIIPTRDLITGTPSYTSVTTSQNNYSVGSSSDVFIDIGSNTVSITGFTATSNYHGRTFRLWFTSTTGALTFAHESASSTDVNRIDCPGASNIFYFSQSGFVDFVYDKQAASGVGRWRLVSEGDRYVYFTNGLGAANLNTNQFTINSYSWAAVPSAATVGSGVIVSISDVGNRPILMRSDGSNWLPLGVQTIYSNTVETTYTGSTTAQIVISVLIPANFFHPNAQIRITFSGGRSAGAGGNVTPAIRVGGNTTGTSTTIYANGATSPVQRAQRDLLFQNSRSTQISPSPGNNASFAAGGSVPTNLGYNFANDQYITFGLTLANAADTGSIYGALIEYVG